MKSRNILMSIILLTSIFLTTVVYSAYNTRLNIEGEAIVRSDQYIRITNITVSETTNGAHETYNNKYNKDVTFMYATLPANSSITYTVEITNKNTISYLINSISQESHTNNNVQIDISLNVNDIVNANNTKTFTIKLTNNTNTTQEETLVYKYGFQLNSFTVTFGPDGGEVSPTSKQVSYGSAYGSLPTPTRPGYTFKGWHGKNLFDNKNGQNGYVNDSGSITTTNTQYLSNQFYDIDTNTSYMLSLNTQAYIIGVAYYDTDKNLILPRSDNYNNSKLLINTSNSSIKYFRFWVYVNSGIPLNSDNVAETYNVQLEKGDIITSYEPYYITSDTTVAQTQNHTLTAIWEPAQYNVTFDANGGSVDTSSKQVTYLSTYGELPTPTRAGYEFVGWELEDNLLPSEYQPVEYIETDNTQYIDTEYIPNYNTKITATFAHNENVVDTPFFGARTSDMGNSYTLWSHPEGNYYNSQGIFNSTTMSDMGNYPIGTKINLEYSNNKIVYGDNSYTWSPGLGTPNVSLILFGLKTGTTIDGRRFGGKLWEFKIWDNDILVRNLIPCKRKSDNIAGLYDIIEGKFYVKKAGNNFSVGPNVSDFSTIITSNTTVTKPGNHTLKAKWEQDNTQTQFETYYSGRVQQFTAPQTGIYQIELWGAQGGIGYYDWQRDPGFGAYTSGNITLNENERIYIYVGGKGGNAEGINIATAGYNGGGEGAIANDNDDASGAGGGATDVRLVSGEWDNFNSLKSRIMVAAGSGGVHSIPVSIEADQYYEAMNGGGLKIEGDLMTWHGFIWTPIVNQTQGYKFGIGHPGIPAGHAGAGAGGGYFGGESHDVPEPADPRGSMSSRASGGTSYISGHAGCIAIDQNSTENNIIQRKDSNNNTCVNDTTDIVCSYHYSNKIFTNTIMIDGGNYRWTTIKGSKQAIPNPSGGNYEIWQGYPGNGYARITFLRS